MTAICVNPGSSSAATNVRPRSGGVPSSVKKLGLTATASTRSGRSPPVMLALNPWICAICVVDCDMSPIVEKLGGRHERDLRVRRPVVDDDELLRIRVHAAVGAAPR